MGKGTGCCHEPQYDELGNKVEYGPWASRGCSDCPCLVVFILAILLQSAVAWVAYRNGEPKQLIFGVDYQGDVCGDSGKHASPNVGLHYGLDGDWSDYRYLWYPIDMSKLISNGDLIGGTSDLWEWAMRNAVCVKQCPAKGDTVYTYGDDAEGNSPPSYYTAKYDSAATLHRCLPVSLPAVQSKAGVAVPRMVPVVWAERSIDRDSELGWEQPYGAVRRVAVGQDNGLGAWLCTSPSALCVNVPLGTSGAVADADKCEQQCAARTGASQLALNVATEAMGDVFDCMHIIGFVALIALAAGALWLIFVRFCAFKVVLVSLLLMFALIGGVGYIIYKHAPSADKPKYWYWTSYAIWGVDALLIIFFLVFRKTLKIACQVVTEASIIVMSSPTTLLLPVCTALFSLVFSLFCGAVYVYVQSMKHTHLPGMLENGLNAVGNSSTWVESNHQTTIEYMWWWNIFFFYWGSCFISDFAFMVLAIVGVYWYYSAPAEDVQREKVVDEKVRSKEAPGVCRALCVVFWHHLGTLAVGSFILAVVKFIRFVFLHFKNTLAKRLGKNTAAAILCCIECMLWCLEKVVEAVSRRAYVITAIDGGSFLGSAWHALKLMVANAVMVGATTFIEVAMEIIGKLLITSFGCVFCYFAIEHWHLAPQGTAVWTPMAVCGLVAYFIAGIFMHVFETITSTLLIVFLHDQEDPEDGDAYMPSELRDILDKIEEHGKDQKFKIGSKVRVRRPGDGLRLGDDGRMTLTEETLSGLIFTVKKVEPEFLVEHEGTDYSYLPKYNLDRSAELSFVDEKTQQGCRWYDPFLCILFPFRLVLCVLTCGAIKCLNPFGSDDEEDPEDAGEKTRLLPDS
eukprot:TRINITY_DN70350_c0_g1_i1.p1 TRINITY_DN70350_c0_g1~~TRINITY_DN70350_c0_g1_i1.p1  ORF type:complete len:879 (+),score=253.37 TRINITY_DN70350_c0_g1_i1:85-2637(+)